MKLFTRLTRLRGCDSGAAAVEFALIAMVAISTFLGIIEFGRGLYIRNEMSYAADIGARKILTDPAVADNDVERAIRDAVNFGTATDLQLTLQTETVDGVIFRTLLVRYPLTLMIPNIAQTKIILTVDRRVPILGQPL